MTARKYSAILVIMAGLASIALQCSAADAEPGYASTTSTAVDMPPLPVQPVSVLTPVVAVPEVPAAAGGADTVAVASSPSTKSTGWGKSWIRVTMFWQNSVWYSSWFNSLSRAVQVASVVPQMSILLQAVTVAGLANSLGNSKTEWTILAPTNDAFVDLLEALNMTAEELLKNKDTLTKVLSYHVVPAVATSNDLKNQQYPTLLGSGPAASVTVIKRPGGGVRIQGGSRENVATVIAPNIRAGRSIIHVIDTVLVPKSNVPVGSSLKSTARAMGDCRFASKPRALARAAEAAAVTAAP